MIVYQELHWLREWVIIIMENPHGLMIFYIPVVILGTIAFKVGLAVVESSMIGELANPFATPLEILPE